VSLDYVAMDLCRMWSRDPEWFYSKTPEEQERLIGFWTVYQEQHGG
jgi:hypothetical protein